MAITGSRAQAATDLAATKRATATRLDAGVNSTWTFTLGSLVFFFVVIDALLVLEGTRRYEHSRSPIDLLLVLLVLAASAMQIRFCWFLRAPTRPRRAWVQALLAPAVLAWAVGFVQPHASLYAAIPVWLAGALLTCFAQKPKRWAMLALAAGVAVTPTAVYWPQGVDAAAHGEATNLWLIVVYAASMPFMLLASLWWWGVVTRLDESRRMAADLAVAQERLRFASDLHDIQGHHLQVIALKAELSARMLDRGHDGDEAAAATQIQEVRAIAKQALEETRSLVAGLRDVALADELENAREVLTLTGAACTLQAEPALAALVRSGAATQRALALSVREGTTNILRHSDATSASISLRLEAGHWELALVNNGIDRAGSVANRGGGSGLDGLRERILALGGTFTAAREDGTFALRVRIPRCQVALTHGPAQVLDEGDAA